MEHFPVKDKMCGKSVEGLKKKLYFVIGWMYKYNTKHKTTIVYTLKEYFDITKTPEYLKLEFEHMSVLYRDWFLSKWTQLCDIF